MNTTKSHFYKNKRILQHLMLHEFGLALEINGNKPKKKIINIIFFSNPRVRKTVKISIKETSQKLQGVNSSQTPQVNLTASTAFVSPTHRVAPESNHSQETSSPRPNSGNTWALERSGSASRTSRDKSRLDSPWPPGSPSRPRGLACTRRRTS
ncbi:hypothetical protein PanWU01x14_090740 [Parasponia andersonii]|uniref:Uncharacterized protein n=1 Tax=Parasponia andersonii TaxID=3476 RepID=A0A2P5D6W5_PARAD|nr:hypothetical protein PanWU01x14_090740 [Parasponia andersonii]